MTAAQAKRIADLEAELAKTTEMLEAVNGQYEAQRTRAEKAEAKVERLKARCLEAEELLDRAVLAFGPEDAGSGWHNDFQRWLGGGRESGDVGPESRVSGPTITVAAAEPAALYRDIDHDPAKCDFCRKEALQPEDCLAPEHGHRVPCPGCGWDGSFRIDPPARKGKGS